MKWETLACNGNIIYTASLLLTPFYIREFGPAYIYRSMDKMREVWYFENIYSIFNYYIMVNNEIGFRPLLNMDSSKGIFVVKLV